MTERQFHLASEWRLDAPLDQVWDALCAVERWPDWWPSVRRVELLTAGDKNGIGAVNRFTWATALPYDLVIVMKVQNMQPLRQIEGHATGELEGVGIWTLEQTDDLTVVRYEWQVDLAKPWMRRLAPLFSPVFAWNHRMVMQRGEQALRRHLELMRG